MDYDEDKVDEAVLALMYLTMFGDEHGARALEGARLGRLGPPAREGVHRRPQGQGEVRGPDRGGPGQGRGAVPRALRQARMSGGHEHQPARSPAVERPRNTAESISGAGLSTDRRQSLFDRDAGRRGPRLMAWMGAGKVGVQYLSLARPP